MKLLDEKIEKLKERYEVHEFKHAVAILKNDFYNEFLEILDILNEFELLASDILFPGGRKSPIAEKIDSKFYSKGWQEIEFDTKIILEKLHCNEKDKERVKEYETPTHKIDCFKNRIAFEIEWNNKTEFYDRDLNNFRLLFDLDAISVGIIITRSTELDDIFKELQTEFDLRNPKAKSKLINKYGASSTHLSKLLPRIKGKSAGGCPLLIIGINKKTYRNDL
ncbi:BglII/BstYI family type II restriction endonuclease [Fusobacterium ulcerans]|uniref:BglII/BstYI family type II restriction endonuclease n=1 Tax=Fusobacterium ulcerans TaxID=861 RepID=UPI0026ED47D2|nr:BglII/BstYI family type II restriction endonuclease [Fusobacterium ulcerans]